MPDQRKTLDEQRADYVKQLRGLEARRENPNAKDVLVVSDQWPHTPEDIDRQIETLKAAIAQIDEAQGNATRS